ncbi:MAG: hypothetical protein J5I81_03475 [Nitrococcus mobilis]|nr:hypothetical protein [Nitrococcus mobilis]
MSEPQWIAPPGPPPGAAAAQERWQESPCNAMPGSDIHSPRAAAQRPLAAPALPLQASDCRPSLAEIEPLARTGDPWPALLPGPLEEPPSAEAEAWGEDEGERRQRLRNEQRGV